VRPITDGWQHDVQAVACTCSASLCPAQPGLFLHICRREKLHILAHAKAHSEQQPPHAHCPQTGSPARYNKWAFHRCQTRSIRTPPGVWWWPAEHAPASINHSLLQSSNRFSGLIHAHGRRAVNKGTTGPSAEHPAWYQPQLPQPDPNTAARRPDHSTLNDCAISADRADHHHPWVLQINGLGGFRR
jgi:hypothetical protein